MFYRILLLVIATIAWLVFYLTGTETHATDGIFFFGLVAGEGLIIWLQSRRSPIA